MFSFSIFFVVPCVRPCVRRSSQAPLAHFLPSFLWPGAAFIVWSQGTATDGHESKRIQRKFLIIRWSLVIPCISNSIPLRKDHELFLSVQHSYLLSVESVQYCVTLSFVLLQRQGLHGERCGHFSIPSENGEQHHWMWRLNLFRGAKINPSQRW